LIKNYFEPNFREIRRAGILGINIDAFLKPTDKMKPT
jgi:hypothetical protein